MLSCSFYIFKIHKNNLQADPERPSGDRMADFLASNLQEDVDKWDQGRWHELYFPLKF